MIAGCAELGDVFVSSPHVFDDGHTAPSKLMVFLGYYPALKSVMVVLCTSQEKHGRRLSAVGCQDNTFERSFLIMPPAKKKGKLRAQQRQVFTVPTWVVLAPEFVGEEALRARFQRGDLRRSFSLAQHELQGMWACLRGGLDFAPIMEQFKPVAAP